MGAGLRPTRPASGRLLDCLLSMAVALCALTLGANAEKYKYRSYDELRAALSKMATEHPTLVDVFTTQERYGLPAVGRCGGADCVVPVLVLTNKTSLAEESARADGDIARPELFVSGALHGNEWIGPQASVGFAEYMLKQQSKRWIKFLLNTRIVVIVPMANADGYFHGRREEDGIDPNRDFGFDQEPTACMTTVAGRSLNELFNEYVFRTAVTFHGGANIIAYEWGDTKHCDGYPGRCRGGWHNDDEKGMRAVAMHMRDYAGAVTGAGHYLVGACNDPNIIYPVRGGMEDWAFGASWHPSAVTCRPTTHGGYAAAKTKYGKATHRCPNFLIETSDAKRPPTNQLGGDEDILHGGSPSDGHVPRNIRLLLVATDLVAPYAWAEVDLAASTPTKLQISWRVGGALSVESTFARVEVLTKANTPQSLGKWTKVESTSQKGFAMPSGSQDTDSKVGSYQASVDVPGGATATLIKVTAFASVDAPWKTGTPQSHLVRARYDPNWSMRNGKHVVVGQAEHGSAPRIFAVKDGKLVPASLSTFEKARKQGSNTPVYDRKVDKHIGVAKPKARGNAEW